MLALHFSLMTMSLYKAEVPKLGDLDIIQIRFCKTIFSSPVMILPLFIYITHAESLNFTFTLFIDCIFLYDATI